MFHRINLGVPHSYSRKMKLTESKKGKIFLISPIQIFFVKTMLSIQRKDIH